MKWTIGEHVGRRIEARRLGQGLTQGQLAHRIGVTAQAVQKYETASVSISVARLYAISQALDAPISFFFEGFEVLQALGASDKPLNGKSGAPPRES